MAMVCIYEVYLLEVPPMMATHAEANAELLLIASFAEDALPESEGMRDGPCTSSSTHLSRQVDRSELLLAKLL